jgi:hypothetical protein
MKHLLAPVFLVVCATACDPVLLYTSPAGRTVHDENAWYVVPVAQGVEARFRASVFTIHGRSEVQVVNNSPSTVEFRPAATVLVAGDGSQLPAKCELPSERQVSIVTGQTVTVRCTFEVPLRGRTYEPAFKTLTVRQPGVSMDGKQLDIVGQMVGP